MSLTLLPQGLDRVGGDRSGFLFVFVHPLLVVFGKDCRHGVLGQERGQIGGESFFADIGLRTASRRLFGTAIIDVAVDVAVLLLFDPFLGGDRHMALAAGQQAAQGLAGLSFPTADGRASR